MSGAEREERFLGNAAKAAAGTHPLSGPEGVPEALERIIPPDAQVYCPGITPIEQAAAALFPNRVPEYGAATVTVEEVFGSIAETGSLVCASEGGRAVQAGLPPPTTWRSCGGSGSSRRWTTWPAAVASARRRTLRWSRDRPYRDIELTLAIGGTARAARHHRV
jgi:hypothetical protein